VKPVPSNNPYGIFSFFFPTPKEGPNMKEKYDPKAFMANERTCLNWNQQAITLGTFGIALFSLSKKQSAAYGGIFLVFLAILVLFYNQIKYKKRWNLLETKGSGLLFLDSFGPLALTILLGCSFIIIIIIKAVSISETTTGFDDVCSDVLVMNPWCVANSH